MGLYIIVSVFILMVSVLIILVVLVQNSKGGGLASNFSGSNQYMGVRKTADFLEKATWTLAVTLLVLSLASIFVIPKGGEGANNVTQVEERAGGPLPGPTAPVPGPGQQPE
ncbi:MAG: preprotein translocase subunit SecG [Bacteroidales bacterium]|nr:preprotein translocase subunit SecG [Bacteroidales bacterium]